MRTQPENRKNLIGQRFGRLVVTEEADHSGKHRQWKCLCDCGNTKIIRQGDLTSGKTKSCRCLQKELFSAREKTHGMSKTPEYQTWLSMKARCYYSGFIGHKDYSDIGIEVCEKWRNDFYAFICDMGKKPGKEYSLDRIDNSKNYSPDNCRWALSKVQNSNRRNAHIITHNGETMTLTQWAEKLGIPRGVLSARICRSKWSVEKSFSTP
jgi:hypothetical protein